MSSYYVANVWDSSRATHSRLLVLLAMADCADHSGRVSISQAAIADMARVDAKTVQKCIAALVNDGEVLIGSPANGPGFPAVYWLTTEVAPMDHGQTAGQSTDTDGDNVAINRMSGIIGADETTEDGGDPLEFQTCKTVTESAAQAKPSAPETELPDAAVAPQPVPAPQARAPMPRHLPESRVGYVLAAAGVQPRQDQPFYWFRKEHEADLDALCKALSMDAAAISARLSQAKVRIPDLRRIADLAEHVRSSRAK